MIRLVSLFVPLLAALSGCATAEKRPKVTVTTVLRVLTPETVSLSVTDPNLFEGPYNSAAHVQRHERFAVVGGMISFTWRIKKVPTDPRPSAETEDIPPPYARRRSLPPLPAATATPLP